MSVLAGYMVPHPPMIVPEIGRGSEAQIEETIRAYEQVADEIVALAPETIIITSPHSIMYSDYFHISPGSRAKGSFAGFRAPEVRFDEKYDTALVSEICRIADAQDLPAGTLGERDSKLDHGTMVPLWFIRNKYKEGSIVRIGLSGLPLTDHYRLGMIIREALNNTGRRAVIVASGDLSHKLQEYGPYGFTPEGPEYDERIMDVMGRAAFGELLDFDSTFCDKAAECGHRSFVIMAGAFDGQQVRATRLSHQDVTGVGYGICTFYPAAGSVYNYSPYNKEDFYTDDTNSTDPDASSSEDKIPDKTPDGTSEKCIAAESGGSDDGAGSIECTPIECSSTTDPGTSDTNIEVRDDRSADRVDESRKFLDIRLRKLEEELAVKRDSEDAFVRLARKAVESYVAAGVTIPVPDDIPEELLIRRAGAFVSIHEHGELRGCIGTIAPTRDNLAKEIIGNAVSASTRDPRFPPVKPEELPWLEISVDVLGEPEDIDSIDELDVKRYGVIVSSGRKRGLLLPDLDGIDTPEQQVDIAMRKGGIRRSDRYTLQRFEVVRHF